MVGSRASNPAADSACRHFNLQILRDGCELFQGCLQVFRNLGGDDFGTNTYERVDKPRGEFVHTNSTGRSGTSCEGDSAEP